MRNYWSCSKFADRIRGKSKFKAGTSDEWHDWEQEAKSAHPIRYWIAEEALDAIQNFIWWPIDRMYDLKYYINNRFVTRTHCLTAHPRDIKPGQWADVGNRFLPCLFNELVDFVEVETAMHNIAWDDKAMKKYHAPFWARGWFRWRTWRCPQAGLDYLDWAMSLTNEDWLDEGEKHKAEPTYQALAAKEIKELYLWWTQIYRNRPDPYSESGWYAYCEKKRKETGNIFSEKESPTLKKEGARAHKLLQKIEANYEKEDEQMLIRLIRVRRSLWT